MDTTYQSHPRVVITGMGAVTPLGYLDSFWDALKAGESGIRRIKSFDPEDLEVQIAGEVDFEPRAHLNPKAARRMARASQFGLVAAQMALEDAGLEKEDIAKDGDRAAVMVGTVNAGFATLVDLAYDFTFRGRKPFPTGFVNGLPNNERVNAIACWHCHMAAKPAFSDPDNVIHQKCCPGRTYIISRKIS